jgi:hypothetical protein
MNDVIAEGLLKQSGVMLETAQNLITEARKLLEVHSAIIEHAKHLTNEAGQMNAKAREPMEAE